MNAIDRLTAEMINVEIDISRARIERARAILHSNPVPVDPTDKVAVYTYSALQGVSMAQITADTAKLNKLLDR